MTAQPTTSAGFIGLSIKRSDSVDPGPGWRSPTTRPTGRRASRIRRPSENLHRAGHTAHPHEPTPSDLRRSRKRFGLRDGRRMDR